MVGKDPSTTNNFRVRTTIDKNKDPQANILKHLSNNLRTSDFLDKILKTMYRNLFGCLRSMVA